MHSTIYSGCSCACVLLRSFGEKTLMRFLVPSLSMQTEFKLNPEHAFPLAALGFLARLRRHRCERRRVVAHLTTTQRISRHDTHNTLAAQHYTTTALHAQHASAVLSCLVLSCLVIQLVLATAAPWF